MKDLIGLRWQVFFASEANICEAAMTQTTKPTKAQVRQYMEDRTHHEDPPPSLEEIRKQLGWKLIPNSVDQISNDTD